MNVKQETVSPNRLKLTIELSTEEFAESMTFAYRKMVKSINIPGFRKGKAPRKIIENYYGESVFYDEAINHAFPAAYDKAIEEHGLNPVERPDVDIEEIGPGKPVVFTAEFYVRPELALGQYKGVEAYKPDYSVTDEQIDGQLEKDRQRLSRWVEVEREAKTGDRVNIDYLGKIDGVAFEGGQAENAPLTLGSGTFIPGFEEQVPGMAIGETKDITVTFPEEYGAKELAGKDAVFTITLRSVSENEVPDIDDDLAKESSDFDTLDEYRADIRRTLEEQAQKRQDDEFTAYVLEAVCKNAAVDIPPPMVESEIDSMVRDLSLRFAYQGIRIEDYLNYTGQTMEGLRKQYAAQAEAQVKNELALAAVIKAENIEPDAEEVDALVAKYAAQSNQSVEEFTEPLTPEQWEMLKNDAAVQKAIEFLKANAVPTDKAPEPPAVQEQDGAQESAEEAPAE